MHIPPVDLSTRKDPAQLPDYIRIKKNRYGEYDGIRINKDGVLKTLSEAGFFRFDDDEISGRYVQIVNNRAKEANIPTMKSWFLDQVDKLPDIDHRWNLADGAEVGHVITSLDIREKMLDSIEAVFKAALMECLPVLSKSFHQDTRYQKFFYFQNCWIEVTATGVAIHDYKDLEGVIWEEQIIQRTFRLEKDLAGCVALQFFNCVAEGSRNPRETKRRKALETVTGYLMHHFFEGKLKAIIFTDSTISDDMEPNGRSGKTLYSYILSHILNPQIGKVEKSVFVQISGRRIDYKKDTVYSKCTLNTRVINLNDLYNNFDVEQIFTDITEGVDVRSLYKNSITIKAKFLLSTNKSIRISGDSAKDRAMVFEFTNYFNASHSPEREFKHWFFTDWDQEQWSLYDNYMVKCAQEYLSCGLVRPSDINLAEKSFRDHTCREFVRWVKFYFDERNPVSIEQSKKLAFASFIENYPDYNNRNFTQRRFTSWLRVYAETINLKLYEWRSTEDKFRFEHPDTSQTTLNLQ